MDNCDSKHCDGCHKHCHSWRHKGRHMCGRHSVGTCLWLCGWLFTIGFLGLSFWSGVLAVFIWPYYLGAFIGG